MRNGQAMVEFVIALFATVVIIAGIADFIVVASRHSKLVSETRGKAGAEAIAASASDMDALLADGETPRAITVESRLAVDFVHEGKEEEVPLSRAMREWVFNGGRDELTVRENVWMPPLAVPLDRE